MKKLVAGILSAVLLCGCAQNGGSDESKTIVVGASPSPHAEILNAVKGEVEAHGYELVVREFSDYIMPNQALFEGSLDANYFQHKPYLEQFNKDNNMDLVSAGAIHYEPFAIYPGKDNAVNPSLSAEDVKEGAIIGIPNDGSNKARALFLLESLGIIQVDPAKGMDATELDILENPKDVVIKPLEAKTLPAQLKDLDYAVINGNYALGAGISDKACVFEDVNSIGLQTYANVLAVRKEDENSEKTKVLLDALTSETAKKFIQETYGDAVVSVAQ